MTAPDLFSYTPQERYPTGVGSREKGGASEEAARLVAPKAKIIRAEVLKLLKAFPEGLTPPEARDKLKDTFRNADCDQLLLSVRSRMSELAADGLAEKSGRRRYKKTAVAPSVYRVRG